MSATFVTLCSVHNVNPGFSIVNVADLCCAIHVLSERIQCAVCGVFQALACDVAPRAGSDFGCLPALFCGHTITAPGPVSLTDSLVPPNS